MSHSWNIEDVHIFPFQNAKNYFCSQNVPSLMLILVDMYCWFAFGLLFEPSIPKHCFFCLKWKIYMFFNVSIYWMYTARKIQMKLTFSSNFHVVNFCISFIFISHKTPEELSTSLHSNYIRVVWCQSQL